MSRNIVDLTTSSPPQQCDPLSSSSLISAINAAHVDQLRLTLARICASSADAARITLASLHAPHGIASNPQMGTTHHHTTGQLRVDEYEEGEETEYETEEASDDGGATVRPQKPPKRLRSRFAICENCEDVFDVAENDEEGCMYHDGLKEPDYESDVWDDWDENCHGPIAYQEKDYPEGFKWSCCEKYVGDEPDGCIKGPHVESEFSNKRARF